MTPSSPLDTVIAFVDAMNRGDLEAAIDHYEPDAVLVVRPGTVLVGRDAIRAALAEMLSVHPSLTTRASQVLVAGDLVLYHSIWNLTATASDGSPLHDGGRSSDVLRRGRDGRWRIALDNPRGTAVLGEV